MDASCRQPVHFVSISARLPLAPDYPRLVLYRDGRGWHRRHRPQRLNSLHSTPRCSQSHGEHRPTFVPLAVERHSGEILICLKPFLLAALSKSPGTLKENANEAIHSVKKTVDMSESDLGILPTSMCRIMNAFPTSVREANRRVVRNIMEKRAALRRQQVFQGLPSPSFSYRALLRESLKCQGLVVSIPTAPTNHPFPQQ